MKSLTDLTDAEKREAEQIVADLYDRGYRWRDRTHGFARGARVRHRGHRWPAAYRDGSGVIVAIAERDPSSWSQSWGAPDIEMVVALDQPTLPEMSRLATLAHYHVDLVSVATEAKPLGGLL